MAEFRRAAVPTRASQAILMSLMSARCLSCDVMPPRPCTHAHATAVLAHRPAACARSANLGGPDDRSRGMHVVADHRLVTLPPPPGAAASTALCRPLRRASDIHRRLHLRPPSRSYRSCHHRHHQRRQCEPWHGRLPCIRERRLGAASSAVRPGCAGRLGYRAGWWSGRLGRRLC